MPHDGHDHDHEHPGGREKTEIELRVERLEAALVAKGLVIPETLDTVVDYYETKVGPRNGAKVVAKAWTDPAFLDALRRDVNAAVEPFGFSGREGHDMKIVENTPDVHNVIVCTLCSCYPWPLLGLPPVWYKSYPYRSRVVREPRAVLAEFGLELDDKVEVRVWDSTAELRYLVIPERPAGTEGWSEDQLAAIVTRNAMVGTEKVTVPAAS